MVVVVGDGPATIATLCPPLFLAVHGKATAIPASRWQRLLELLPVAGRLVRPPFLHPPSPTLLPCLCFALPVLDPAFFDTLDAPLQTLREREGFVCLVTLLPGKKGVGRGPVGLGRTPPRSMQTLARTCAQHGTRGARTPRRPSKALRREHLEHLECSHQPHIQGRGAQKRTRRSVLFTCVWLRKIYSRGRAPRALRFFQWQPRQ